MPCSALSAVCLRSCSIQPCRVSAIMPSWQTPPSSVATSSSQRRTSGSCPRTRTKRGISLRAYGNSTCLTKAIELVVPSMSVRIVRAIACSGRSGLAVAWEALGDIGTGEVADPAVGLLEEPDRHEAGLRAHVEPVGGAVGHRDQVVLHALDLVHLAVHMQGEQVGSGDEEADLVLLVVVLVEELAAQFLAFRMVRGNADHVDAGEATLGHQAGDVFAVGGQHLFLAGAGCDRGGGLPAFEGDADPVQLAGDFLAVPAVQQRGVRCVVGEDAQSAHG